GHLQHFLAGMLVADLVARRPAWSPVSAPAAVAARAAGTGPARLGPARLGPARLGPVRPAPAWWADAAGVLGLVLILASQSSTRARALALPLGVAGCLVAA